MTPWGIAPGQLLRHHGWQDEHVVYNDLSGDTHLLNNIAWELLTTLQQQPFALPELAVRLGLGAEDKRDLLAMLDSLRQLGLLER